MFFPRLLFKAFSLVRPGFVLPCLCHVDNRRFLMDTICWFVGRSLVQVSRQQQMVPGSWALLTDVPSPGPLIKCSVLKSAVKVLQYDIVTGTKERHMAGWLYRYRFHLTTYPKIKTSRVGPRGTSAVEL